MRLGVFVLFNGLIISKIIHRGVIKYEAHIQNLGTFMVLCAKINTFGQIYTHTKKKFVLTHSNLQKVVRLVVCVEFVYVLLCVNN